MLDEEYFSDNIYLAVNHFSVEIRRIYHYHVLIAVKQDFDEFCCEVLEINLIKPIPW